MMNFTSLYYFTVVVEEENITKAAEKLHISQQGLSKTIIRLEQELNTPLFLRKPAFSLTYAGMRLYESAKHILYTKDRVMTELSDLYSQKKEVIRIGISQARSEMLLPMILPTFMKLHPGIQLSFVQGAQKYIEDSLHYDDIDLLFSFSPVMVEDVEMVPLLREWFYLVIPKKIIKDKYGEKYGEIVSQMKQNVQLSLFEDCPFILMNKSNRSRTIFEKYASEQGVSPNIKIEAESVPTLLRLACAGVGITVYPGSFSMMNNDLFTREDSPIVCFPIRDESTVGTFVIAYKKWRKLSYATNDFIAHAVSSTKQFKGIQNLEGGKI